MYNFLSKSNQQKPRNGFFDDDEDIFGGMGMGSMLKNFGFGGFGKKDPFGDFFGEFDRMGGGMGGFGGTSTSISTSTIIK